MDALTLPAAIAEQAETLSDEELGLSDGVEGAADAQTQIDESVSAAEA